MNPNPLTPTITQPKTPTTLKGLLQAPDYQNRLREILGERAPQFAASIVQVANGSEQLKRCEPHSLIAAAMTAAILDLPIDKNLGFAHIIPYKGLASFQMGYKGFIQLAVRSGQYRLLNTCRVCEGELVSYNELTGEVVLDPAKKKSDKVVGYAAYFKLVNGYEHATYWTYDKVEKHAARYSQAYKAKKQDSPWFVNFDSMGLKTVIKDLISHWGIMSVQMQKALSEDQGVRRKLDSDVEYLDNSSSPSKPEHTLDVEIVSPPTPEQSEPRGGALPVAAKVQASPIVEASEPEVTSPEFPPLSTPPTETEKAQDQVESETLIKLVASLEKKDGITRAQVITYGKKAKLCSRMCESLEDWTNAKLKVLTDNWPHIIELIRKS